MIVEREDWNPLERKPPTCGSGRVGRANDGTAYGGPHWVPVGQVYPTLAASFLSFLLALSFVDISNLLSLASLSFCLTSNYNFIKIILHDRY